MSEDCGFQFDEIVVDTSKFLIFKSGRPATLAPRAFDVLVYLIKNHDRVIPKQELFEAVWKETFVTDSALTKAVKEIRQELGDDAASPRYIKTVHKRGYRFVGPLREPDNAESGESQKRVAELSTEIDAADIEATISRSDRAPAVRRPVTTVAMVLAGVLAVGALLWFGYGRNTRVLDSLAVIPLVVENGGPEIEQVSDGLTESIIESLSRVARLNVKGSVSSFRYKGKEVQPKKIGQDLDVDAILTGRLVQRGDELTTFISLIDARTENNLWSRQYQHRTASLLTLQNEIVRDVAVALGADLNGSDIQRIAKSSTANPEAHQLYLKGRYYFLTTRNMAAETGSSYYRQAIAVDPNYALAYAGLAEAAIGMAFRSEMPSTEVFPRARLDAERALQLDGQLPEAHIALGFCRYWYDWDWAGAEDSFKRARELNPNSPDAHFAYGTLLFNTGRTQAGLDAVQTAIDIDPLNLRNATVHSQFMTFDGRPDDALQNLQKILELEPNFYLAHLTRSQAFLEKAMFAEAISAALEARRLNELDSTPIAFVGYAHARSGNFAEARVQLNELLRLSASRYITPYHIAFVYHALGERNEALRWLERAVDTRDLRMAFLKVEPKWDDLRGEPRFQEIMRRVGLSED